MAKNMARIKDNIVINIEYCSDNEKETNDLIEISDRNVSINDSFYDGKFYHDGNIILSKDEMIIQADKILAALIEEIYQKDLETVR